MMTSIFTKVFREDICNNFNRDPLTSKLEELNRRFVNLNENSPFDVKKRKDSQKGAKKPQKNLEDQSLPEGEIRQAM